MFPIVCAVALREFKAGPQAATASGCWAILTTKPATPAIQRLRTTRRYLQMMVKFDTASYPVISVFCKATDNTWAGVQYNLTDFVGDGWRFFEADLKNDFEAVNAGKTLESISCFLIGGEDFYIDDIVASDGTLDKAYQLIPDGLVASYLGCEDGITRTQYTTPDPDEYNVTQGVQWYYQYNDLGDVLAWAEYVSL